jgi:hypothetical protein
VEVVDGFLSNPLKPQPQLFARTSPVRNVPMGAPDSHARAGARHSSRLTRGRWRAAAVTKAITEALGSDVRVLCLGMGQNDGSLLVPRTAPAAWEGLTCADPENRTTDPTPHPQSPPSTLVP